MSTLAERALATTDLYDPTLWSEIGAPFQGADPEPDTVRDHLLAASILALRHRRQPRAGLEAAHALKEHAPGAVRWVVEANSARRDALLTIQLEALYLLYPHRKSTP